MDFIHDNIISTKRPHDVLMSNLGHWEPILCWLFSISTRRHIPLKTKADHQLHSGNAEGQGKVAKMTNKHFTLKNSKCCVYPPHQSFCWYSKTFLIVEIQLCFQIVGFRSLFLQWQVVEIMV